MVVLASCLSDTVRVWDLASGESRALEGHGGPVKSVAVTPDGRTVVSALDNTVRVWDLLSGQTIATFYSDAVVNDCALSNDGALVIAGDDAGQVHFLKLER
jgi:WD40 repeat protein